MNKEQDTVDSQFSIDVEQLTNLVRDVNNAWQSLGSNEFGVTDGERKTIQYRPSIYVVKNLKKGDLITRESISVIRPGLGLKPKYFDKVMGMHAKNDIMRGVPLSWEMIY